MKEGIIFTGEEFKQEIQPLLTASGWQWEVVTNTEALLSVVESSLPDVLVTYRLPINTIEDLLTLLNLHQFQFLPVYAVVPEPHLLEAALKLPIGGAAFVPVSRTEVGFKLERLLQVLDTQRTIMEGGNWQGNLEEFNLIDLLQLVESTGKEGVIEFRYLDWQATLFFYEGRPIHAEMGELNGLPAIFKMGGWHRGVFQVKFKRLPRVEDSIGLSTQDVLVQLMAKISEQESLKQQLPSYTEDLLYNPFVKLEQVSPLQERILDILQNPRPLFQILLMLPEDDREILKEILILWEKGAVGLRQEVEQRIEQEEQQKGVGRLLSTFTRLFRRKEEHPTETVAYHYEEEPPEIRVDVQLPSLTNKDFDAIREKLG